MKTRYLFVPLLLAVLLCASGPPVTAQNVKVMPGTTVKLDGPVSIVLQGSLTNSGTYSMSSSSILVVSNTSAATLSGIPEITNIVKRGEGELLLANSVEISGSVTFEEGVINSGSNTVTLTPTATVTGEEGGTYLVGNLSTAQTVGTGSTTFGGIGVTIAAGVDDIGSVTADYSSGVSATTIVGAFTSISRIWKIASTQPPTNGRLLSLTWIPDDDNGLDLTSVSVWKSTDQGSSWLAVGVLQDASMTHSVDINDDSFGWYTIGNGGFECPADISVAASGQSCVATVSYTLPAAASLLGTLTFDPPDLSSFQVGTHAVQLSTSTGYSCTFNVTVIDDTPPVVVTKDITVQLDASGSAAIMAMDIDNGSSDACGIDTRTVSPNTFDCGDVGTHTVTLTVADVHGNFSSATAVVTVEDNVPPTVLTQNLTVALDASGAASIAASQVDNGSADACGIDSRSVTPGSFTCADVGTNTVTLSVTDVNGNTSTATAIVTVEDNILPIALVRNLTVQLDATGSADITAAQIDDGSSDACGIAARTVTPSSFGCADVGTNSVTFAVTDANGNVATTTALVTVEDNIAPVVVAQNITVQLDATGSTVISAAQVDNGSTDACGIDTRIVTPSVFTCANVGENTVTLTVTDVNGNSASASAIVVVENPVTFVTQPVDQTVLIGSTATFTVVVTGSPELQWQYRASGTTAWNEISGATSTALTITNVTAAQNGDQYRVRAILGCTMYSDEVTLTTKVQLADLGPVLLFLGVTDNAFNNRRADVRVDFYKNSTLIGTETALAQKVSGNAENSSKRITVPLTLHNQTFLTTDEFSCKVYIRKADNGNDIGIRFWYDDSPFPNINHGNKGYARIDKVTVSNTTYDYYYLRGGSTLFLSTTPGTAGANIQVSAGSVFQHVGTWSILGSQMKRFDDAAAAELTLYPNYPNPFNPATTISFAVPEEMRVRLGIYNSLGALVETLAESMLAVGTYSIQWFAPSDIPSGVFTVRLVGRTRDGRETIRTQTMLLTK
ncbi:MAG: hypothetical protein IH600_05845 [Bacteroidetes bacterium]|nr:hypothetical protein [Bacteroidota bacterium]